MSTSVYTGLNPFNFIRKIFLQTRLWDVSYVRSYCSFQFIKRAWAMTIHCNLVHSAIPNSLGSSELRCALGCTLSW
jgi:hypothetical protein